MIKDRGTWQDALQDLGMATDRIRELEAELAALRAQVERYREALDDIAAYQTVGKGAVTTDIIERAREALAPSAEGK